MSALSGVQLRQNTAEDILSVYGSGGPDAEVDSMVLGTEWYVDRECRHGLNVN